ncbi:MAG TPA: hypothetical protein VK357_10235, partial [Rubrobacteraceae bacterium]|nr:hypothetical protein [Rubrobacteraceae bacterium]
ASQKPSVSPGHRHHPTRGNDPWAWEDAQFYCSRYVNREGVGRAGVANSRGCSDTPSTIKAAL